MKEAEEASLFLPFPQLLAPVERPRLFSLSFEPSTLPSFGLPYGGPGSACLDLALGSIQIEVELEEIMANNRGLI